MIQRGTTPVHKFILPFAFESIAEIVVVYRQNHRVKLIKDSGSMDIDVVDNAILVPLTQNDTLSFSVGPKYRDSIVEIQYKVMFTNEQVFTSSIIRDRVVDSLHDGPIIIGEEREIIIDYDGGDVIPWEEDYTVEGEDK